MDGYSTTFVHAERQYTLSPHIIPPPHTHFVASFVGNFVAFVESERLSGWFKRAD